MADHRGAVSDLIRFGTSTWTYPGWKGLVYSRDYPKTGATAAMLAEYARNPLFRTVGVDSFFYRPPSAKTLREYAAALPAGFECVMKVWDRITVETFESPRETGRRGDANPDFLNADLFIRDVVDPLRADFAGHAGPLVFEFQRLRGKGRLQEFLDRLDAFFGRLPTDMRYAVELRNSEMLGPEYFALLRTHGVGHVYNSWTAMPRIGDQLLMHDSITAPFIVSRALLVPGRKYAEAVDLFAPYDRIQEPNPELRADLAAVARTAVELRIPAYLIVNNRAEGCAPETIRAIIELLL